MRIDFINKTNKFFPKVVELGKKYSATLGFMPDGGFEDHANKRCIIIAYDDNQLLGYLMYREVPKYSRVSIVHLCIDERYRGKHIPNNLLDALKNKYKTIYIYKGISLSCRDDYKHASQMWQNYGFILMNSVRSRSVEEHHLGLWWFDYNKPDLFSNIETSKVKASLDMNIIIKLRDSSIDKEPSQDPRPLMADWLANETDYYYAPECLNEIVRDGNYDRTCQTRDFIKRNFNEARCNADEVKLITKDIENIIKGHSDNDESDRKQIATSIVAGMNYFITLDIGIINKREEIYSKYNLQIFTPVEFVLRIDQLLHGEEYIPTLLKGVAFSTIKNTSDTELKECIDDFSRKLTAEQKIELKNIVCKAVSNKSNRIKIIRKNDLKAAFYSYEYSNEGLIVIFTRINDNIGCQTLFMQILSDFIKRSIFKNITKIIYKDTLIEGYKEVILKKFGFIKAKSSIWEKYVINKIVEKNDLKKYLPDIAVFNAVDLNNNSQLLNIEKMLFPLKIYDLDIHCYIIPIKAIWAGHLFDYKISSCDFWGAQEKQLWNIENVYFRHKKPITEISPARILWYVSEDKKDNSSRSKAIVATSYLDEVMTGKPKDLYSTNKHFGIYEWKDIFALSDNNINKDIRALRFSRTEVFDKTVSYKAINQIFETYGKKISTFNSPVQISIDIFNQIYKLRNGKK
jgi:predicted nucleic acid-binding protein